MTNSVRFQLANVSEPISVLRKRATVVKELNILCKILCHSHDDQRVGRFLKQRIPMALQNGNTGCVLETVQNNLLHIVFQTSISLQLF